MKPETLAELVARTVIEFEKREAQQQKEGLLLQQQKQNKSKSKSLN
jgi:hypothetical protein